MKRSMHVRLDINYAKGEGNGRFAYDVLAQRPVVGFAFRF